MLSKSCSHYTDRCSERSKLLPGWPPVLPNPNSRIPVLGPSWWGQWHFGKPKAKCFAKVIHPMETVFPNIQASVRMTTLSPNPKFVDRCNLDGGNDIVHSCIFNWMQMIGKWQTAQPKSNGHGLGYVSCAFYVLIQKAKGETKSDHFYWFLLVFSPFWRC